MGIRFYCPNGHKLNVKEFQAGRRGICPYCGTKFLIPSQSTRKSSKEDRAARRAFAAAAFPSLNPPFQNAEPGISGNMPAGSAQTSTPNPSPLPPIIAASKTEADISSQPTDFFSQQDGERTGFDSPILPTPADPATNILTTFSLDDPSVALKYRCPGRSALRSGRCGLVRTAAFRRSIRTGHGQIDASVVGRGPHQSRYPGLARRMARLAAGFGRFPPVAHVRSLSRYRQGRCSIHAADLLAARPSIRSPNPQ